MCWPVENTAPVDMSPGSESPQLSAQIIINNIHVETVTKKLVTRSYRKDAKEEDG